MGGKQPEVVADGPVLWRKADTLLNCSEHEARVLVKSPFSLPFKCLVSGRLCLCLSFYYGKKKKKTMLRGEMWINRRDP